VLTGRDGRVGDTPQRTTIAAADGELHDERVFDGHNASPGDHYKALMKWTRLFPVRLS
jgi:hypothetical protein